MEASRELPFPSVATVPLLRPFAWLALGWADLRACVGPALFYGACFAGMGLSLQLVFRHAAHYVSALASGFLLIGPFLAIGLYEISRRRQRGLPASLGPTLGIWRGNAGNIGLYSLIVIVIFLVWARASLVVFALFYTSEMPSIDHFLDQILRMENIEFLVVYATIGSMFAALVFAFSVVSIPLMLDRNQDAVTAMIASFLALVHNLPAMFLWAILIVVLTAIGFATAYVGLLVVIPIVGMATWHAYRDLVKPLAADDGADLEVKSPAT